MNRSYCGVGDVDDPTHREICLMCKKGYWREQHPNLLALRDMTAVLVVFLIFVFLSLRLNYYKD